MGRRYRRGSDAGSLISGTVRAAKRMSPFGAITLGLVGFFVFYIGLPEIIDSLAESQKNNRYAGAFSQFFLYRIHWSERLGLAILAASSLVAMWNYYRLGPMGTTERGLVGFLSRLISRNLD